MAAVTSLTVILISFLPFVSQAVQLVLLSITLLLGVAMLVAAGLLIGGYHEFFGQARGVAFWMALFMLTVFLTSDTVLTALHPALSPVLTVIILWGFVASLVVGPTLLIYLVRTDKSVTVFAITYLLLVWVLFSLGQYMGWDTFLQRLVLGTTGEVFWPIQGLICGSIWVTITATMAFIWNTSIYLSRERSGVRRIAIMPDSELKEK